MHVCFVDTLLPQFLMDSLVNSLIFEVFHLDIRFGTLGAHVKDDCWHIWVGEGSRCLGHDEWLAAIYVVYPKVPFHLLHCPGEIVRGFWPKVEDVTFQITELALEVGIGFRIWTLGFFSSILTSSLLGIGLLYPILFSQGL